MDHRRPCSATLVAAVIAVALASTVETTHADQRSDRGTARHVPAPQRFLKHRFDKAVDGGGPGLVRIRLALTTDPVGRAAVSPQLRHPLSSIPPAFDQRLMR